jgi:hypothetical protein
MAGFPRIHYGLDFHGPNCWKSDTKSVNWVCLQSPLVGITSAESVSSWEASPYSQVSFSVPNDWKTGLIWVSSASASVAVGWPLTVLYLKARRNCGAKPGPDFCLSGGCDGGLLCDPITGIVSFPPTPLSKLKSFSLILRSPLPNSNCPWM